VTEQVVLLDSVKEGVVIVSNELDRNNAVNKDERELLFFNEPAK